MNHAHGARLAHDIHVGHFVVKTTTSMCRLMLNVHADFAKVKRMGRE